jgi:hypothetical protein
VIVIHGYPPTELLDKFQIKQVDAFGAWGWSLNPDQVTIISGYQIISSQASFLAIFGA